ncbi:DNA polymerase III subunit delta [Desulfurobacterium thermolithotrophum]|uniref:DNA polymerase III subunit delta n=1 Tax=Desulfurobacterium thermolithotrophum TaxID=64160 RepID=UPI0013D4F9D8|nr:DNA polymerase III subunit delta [Desulfurobacterium thermolithotrophum]
MKVVKVQDVLKQLKTGKLPFKKVLIHGEEAYLTEQLLKKVSEVTDIEKFYVDENIDSFFNFTGTSLFGKSPVPVILNVEKLNEVLRKKVDKERFLKILKTFDEFILVSMEELDYKKLKSELFSEIQKLIDATVVSERYSEKAIYSLLKRKFDSAGKKITPEVLKLIVETVGTDLRELRNETDKLILYPDELTPESVKLLLFSSGKVNVFELIFPLLEGNRRKFLEQVEILLSCGGEPLSIIGLLQTQLRQIISLANGIQVKLPREVLQKYKAILQKKKLLELLFLLKTLHEKEFAVKRGEVSGEDALKSIVFSY